MADGGSVIRPLPVQEAFLRSSATEVLYGGAAGGGKTEALIYNAAERVAEKHYHALAIRRTFGELESSYIERSKELYPHLGGTYNAQHRRWKFASGARISFGYVDALSDTDQYQSAEFQCIEWDELTTQKSAKPYEFMFSRLRSSKGLETYMRSASNPGGAGHVWVFQRFAPWLWQPGVAPYPGALTEKGEIPRPRPGQVLWMRRDANGVHIVTHRRWHDPKCRRCNPNEPCVVHQPVSRQFIPSRVHDNPFLAGTSYERTLHDLPPLERARLLNGDWNIMPAAGMYFRREQFAGIDVRPSDVIARVRYWDRAATEGGGDWTVGVLMSVIDGPRFVVEDVIRAQRGPGGVEKLIVQTAELDAPLGTLVALEQDPAQAGKVEMFHYAKALVGYPFVALPPQGSKLTRARPVSSQVYAGNVCIVRGAWNHAYLSVLEAYDGTEDGVDDDVDATSGAFRVLLTEYHRRRRTGRGAKVTMVGGTEPNADETA